MDDARRLALDSVTSYVRFGVTMLVQFFLVPVMLSSLGTEGYGLWTLTFSILGILTLVDMGFSTSVVRFTAEARGTRTVEARNRILGTVMAVFLLLVVVLTAGVGATSLFYDRVFDLDVATAADGLLLLWVLSLRMIVGLPLSMFRSILFGDRKITQVNIIQAAGALAYGVLGWVVLKAGGGIMGLAWVNVGTLLVEYLAYLVLAYATVEGLSVSPFNAERSSLVRILGISVAQFVVAVSGLILLTTDPILIKLFMPLSAVALYGIGLKVAESVFMLLKQGVNVLGPRAAEYHGAGQSHLLLDFMISGMKFATAPAAVLLFGVWVFGAEGLRFWLGDGFQDAVPILKVLVTAVCLSVPQLVAFGILTMTGHHVPAAIATAAGAVLNVALSLALIPYLGLIGVALGTLAASVLVDILVVLWLTGRYYGLTYGLFVTQVVLPQVVPSVLCVTVLAAFHRWLPPWDIPSLLAVGSFAAAAYGLVFLAVSLTPQERDFLRRVVGRKPVEVLKTVVDSWPLDKAFARDYRELHRESPDSGLFNSLDWILGGLQCALGPGDRPVPVRFVDGRGRTQAMAIFVSTRYRSRLGGVRVLRTADSNTQRYCPIVSRDRDARRLAALALADSFGATYDLIDLFKVTRDFVRDVRSGTRSSVRVYDRQPRIVLRGSFEDFLADHSRAHRKKIKRRLRYVEDEYGPLTFVRLRDPADYDGIDLVSLLADLFRLYRQKWLGDPDVDQRVIRLMEPFVTSVALQVVGQGTLDIGMLKAGQRLLAFDISFVANGVVNMICGAFDPEAARVGPGGALLVEEIRDSCRRGDRRIEFGGGYLDYKLLWTRNIAESWHVRVFSRTWMGRVKRMVWLLDRRHLAQQFRDFLDRMFHSRLNGLLFRFDSFHVYRFTGIKAAPPESAGLTARAVTPPDLPALCACRQMADTAAGIRDFERRMERGGTGTALLDGDKVVAYGWSRVGSNLREDGDRYVMNLGPNGAYVFDTFIHPEYRGRGLYPVLVKAMADRGLPKGVNRHYVTIDTLNAGSIRAHEKIGVERIETIRYLDARLFQVHEAITDCGRRQQVDPFWRRRTFVSGAIQDDR